MRLKGLDFMENFRKIIDYYILNGPTRHELIRKVKEHLNIDWEIIGVPLFNRGWNQAIIKYEPQRSRKPSTRK